LNVKINVDTFNVGLNKLIKIGIIGKYGRYYKIIPEILQNILILKLVNKDELKYISSSFIKELDESILERLIKNIFRSLWKDDPLYKDSKDIIEQIIILLIDFLKSKDTDKAHAVLKTFASVAYCIPEYAKDIVVYVYNKYFKTSENRVVIPEKSDKLWGKMFYEIEIEKAAEIAYWVAVSARDKDTKKLMLQILWDLGKNNKERTNSCPEHPLRRLEDLSSFKHYRFRQEDYEFYNLLLDCVEEWLKEFEANNKPERTPIGIFGKILDWQWENISSIKGGMLLKHGHLVYDSNLEEIKIRAVEMLINSFKNRTLLQHYDYFHAGLGEIHGILPYYADKDRINWKKLSKEGLGELKKLAEYYINGNQPIPAFRVIYELRDYFENIKEYSDIQDIKLIINEIEQKYESKYPGEYKIFNVLIREQFRNEPEKVEIRELARILLEKDPVNNFNFLENIHKEIESINWSIFNIALATISFDDNEQQEKWAVYCLQLAELICEKSNSNLFSGAGPHFLTNIRKYLIKKNNDEFKQKYIKVLKNYKNKAVDGLEKIKEYIQYELKRFFWFLIRDVNNITLYPEEIEMIKSWEYEPDHTLVFIIKELSKTNIDLAKAMIFNIKTGNDEKKADLKCSAVMNNDKIKELITESELNKLLEEMIDVPEVSLNDGYNIQELIVFYSNKSKNYSDIVFNFFERRLNKYENEYGKGIKHEYKPTPSYFSEHDYRDIFSKMESETRTNYLKKIRDIINENKKPFGFVNYDTHLFSVFANNYSNEKINKEIVQILEEWVDTVDYKKIVTISRIIKNSYNTFVFDFPDLIIKILRNVEKLEKSNPDLKDFQIQVQSHLTISAELGLYKRTLGQASDKYVNMEQKSSDIIREYKLNITDPAYGFYYNLIQLARQNIEREKLSDEEDD